jgi:hypothetical protein
VQRVIAFTARDDVIPRATANIVVQGIAEDVIVSGSANNIFYLLVVKRIQLQISARRMTNHVLNRCARQVQINVGVSGCLAEI